MPTTIKTCLTFTMTWIALGSALPASAQDEAPVDALLEVRKLSPSLLLEGDDEPPHPFALRPVSDRELRKANGARWALVSGAPLLGGSLVGFGIAARTECYGSQTMQGGLAATGVMAGVGLGLTSFGAIALAGTDRAARKTKQTRRRRILGVFGTLIAGLTFTAPIMTMNVSSALCASS
jgi:hypothetical protein